MGRDVHAYTTNLMRYLKGGRDAKKGGELPDADKWNNFGAVGGVLQQQNGFYCGAFSCIFHTFFLKTVPFFLARMKLLINNVDKELYF